MYSGVACVSRHVRYLKGGATARKYKRISYENRKKIERMCRSRADKALRRSLTGDKPAALLDFSGHAATSNARVFEKGWEFEEEALRRFSELLDVKAENK